MIATKHILPKSVKAIRSTCNVYLNWTSAAPRKPVFGLEGQCTSCRWFWLDVSAVSMIGRCLTRRAPPDLTGMPDTQMSLRDSLMSETPRPEGLHTWTSPSLIAGVAETGSLLCNILDPSWCSVNLYKTIRDTAVRHWDLTASKFVGSWILREVTAVTIFMDTCISVRRVIINMIIWR